jgi:plastocyanin domain-containing protein
MSTSWGRAKNLGFIQKAAGILLIVFAVFTMQAGLALTNFAKTSPQPSQLSSQTSKAGETAGGLAQEEQVVSMKITNAGFEPNVLKIKKNIPVKWEINGDQATGCTNKIVVPSMNIAKNIAAGENVIKFAPRDSGVISFSCGMGMVRGKFIVQ